MMRESNCQGTPEYATLVEKRNIYVDKMSFGKEAQ